MTRDSILIPRRVGSARNNHTHSREAITLRDMLQIIYYNLRSRRDYGIITNTRTLLCERGDYLQ
jgi:hypothetical protein